MHICALSCLSNRLETLVINGGLDVMLMDLWPSKKQMIVHMSVVDMKRVTSYGLHCQIDIDVAKSC